MKRKNGMNEENLKFGSRQHKFKVSRINWVGIINFGDNFGSR
jgi:hypothetical protein